MTENAFLSEATSPDRCIESNQPWKHITVEKGVEPAEENQSETTFDIKFMV